MNTKELQLVSFKQAKRLKAAGFDWKESCTVFWYDCFGTPSLKTIKAIDDYHDSLCFIASTVALALQWFRNVKGIKCASSLETWYNTRTSTGTTSYYPKIEGKRSGLPYDSNEAAESALLDELLNLIDEL